MGVDWIDRKNIVSIPISDEWLSDFGFKPILTESKSVGDIFKLVTPGFIITLQKPDPVENLWNLKTQALGLGDVVHYIHELQNWLFQTFGYRLRLKAYH